MRRRSPGTSPPGGELIQVADHLGVEEVLALELGLVHEDFDALRLDPLHDPLDGRGPEVVRSRLHGEAVDPDRGGAPGEDVGGDEVLAGTVCVDDRRDEVLRRTESLESVEVPAVVAVGSERLSLPPLNAWWQRVEGTFIADAPTAHIAIVLSGPVNGLGVDDLEVSARGDASAGNLVPNPSFEQVSAEGRIVNRSLVLPSDRAVLAVAGSEGDASWVVTDAAGAMVADGAQHLSHGVTALPLTDVGQGYYTASVTDAAGATTETPIAVIDMPDGSVAPDRRFGVGLHVENDYYADAADLAASLGVGLARNDILWARNERTRGVYEFQPYYTDGFAKLHSHGIHLLGIVNYGNELYGDKKVPSNPEAIAAYGRYAAAIAERFDLVGLEVFNEFNHSRFNASGCGTAPTCYIPLLQSVRDAVHAVDPALPIVAGSTANYESEWFDDLWRAGGLPLADAVSYHPYQVTADPEALGGIVRESYAHMKDLAGDTRPVWITELGMTSTPSGITLEGQADFALRATLTALSAGVEHFFWYDLINDSTDGALHEGNFGLFFQARDGVAALPPKPAAYAYAPGACGAHHDGDIERNRVAVGDSAARSLSRRRAPRRQPSMRAPASSSSTELISGIRGAKMDASGSSAQYNRGRTTWASKIWSTRARSSLSRTRTRSSRR